MGQPTQGIDTGTAERLAALAIVVQRFTERNQLTLGFSNGEDSSRVVVPLDDDPTFTLLVRRILDGLDTGAGDASADPDATLAVDADGDCSFTGAPDLPTDLERRVAAGAARRRRRG